MARGWESKAVEAQQEEATRHQSGKRAPTAEELVRAERRRTLELMKTRASDDLGRATVPAHRTMLERAIASLDQQLAGLND